MIAVAEVLIFMPAAGAVKTEHPVQVALRLKLQNWKITEAEHLLAGIHGNNMGTLGTSSSGSATGGIVT